MQAGITFRELLGWIGSETTRYEIWFAGQPASVWQLPAGTGRLATLRDLLHHTYAVDVRLGQSICGLPVSASEDEVVGDPMVLFPLARRGQALLLSALDGSIDLDEIIGFQTRSLGILRVSRRKILAHSLTHHIRHLAQVATLLRQQGYSTDWPHDLLLSEALA